MNYTEDELKELLSHSDKFYNPLKETQEVFRKLQRNKGYKNNCQIKDFKQFLRVFGFCPPLCNTLTKLKPLNEPWTLKNTSWRWRTPKGGNPPRPEVMPTLKGRYPSNKARKTLLPEEIRTLAPNTLYIRYEE